MKTMNTVNTMNTVKIAVLASTLLVACGDEGPPNPVPLETPDIAEAVPPGETVRTVEVRNPMSQRPGNLLVDGDFELSIVIEGTGPQAGWRPFDANGFDQRYMRGATGGMCRSGLRCAWLDPGVILLGEGTAANGTGMIASVYTRPPEGFTCSTMSAEVIQCGTFSSTARLFPESEDPGADGWCYYRARVPRQNRATCMLLQSSVIGEATLLDDAAIVPDSGQTPLSTRHVIPETKFEPLVGKRREQVRALMEWRRDNTKLGAPLQRRIPIGRK